VDPVPAVAAALFGILIFLMLPREVVVLSDDFGYLRSVAETLRRGRPWTDDWLAPWSASLSALSALLFVATGSFRLATYGLLGLLATVTFFVMFRLLRDRGVSARYAVAVTALLLTFPTVLWKSIEFTGVALHMTCLLLGIWAAEQKRWVLFGLIWAVALASRQSALAWVAIPLAGAYSALRDGPTARRGPSRFVPAIIAVAGVALCGGLRFWMNKTHAQSVVIDRLLETISPPLVLRTFGIGLAIFLVAGGLAAAVLRTSGGAAAGTISRSRIRMAALIAGAVAVLVWDVRHVVYLEHQAFVGRAGLAYTKAILLLSLCGWAFGGVRLRGDLVLAAFVSLALVCARSPEVYDYYFLDVAAFGFLAVQATSSPKRSDAPNRRSAWVPLTVVAVLAAFHVGFVIHFKVALDRAAGLCDLSERALRAGVLRPDELAFAPFGFAGWHLFPHWMTHEGIDDRNIAGFQGYLRAGSVMVTEKRFPRPAEPETSSRMGRVVMRARYPLLWFFQTELSLLRPSPKAGHESPPIRELGPDYAALAFPLDNEEWVQTMSRPGR
jgi:hypothetical protein